MVREIYSTYSAVHPLYYQAIIILLLMELARHILSLIQEKFSIDRSQPLNPRSNLNPPRLYYLKKKWLSQCFETAILKNIPALFLLKITRVG